MSCATESQTTDKQADVIHRVIFILIKQSTLDLRSDAKRLNDVQSRFVYKRLLISSLLKELNLFVQTHGCRQSRTLDV